MGKFRKKPVVIDAFKWTGGPDQNEDPEWIIEAIENGVIGFLNSGTSIVQMTITTTEGVVVADPGYYIIRGIAGEIYPCRPDIFEASYEAVDE